MPRGCSTLPIFPGPLAKRFIAGIHKRLKGGLRSHSIQERVGGRCSIVRRLGYDCSEVVIVDSVERLQKAGDSGCAPLRGIGNALPIGEGDRLGPIGRVLPLVSLPVECGGTIARVLAPADEQAERA